MRYLLIVFALFGSLFVAAQDVDTKNLRKEVDAKKIEKDPKDTSNKTWKVGGLFSLNLSQSNLKNWAGGGDDYSLSLNTSISGYAYYKKDKISWDNTGSFNVGYINTTSLGGRKNDDRFDLLSKYGYALNKKLNLSTIFNFRTQFFPGYNYIDANTTELTSDFMSPAYILLGLGLDYKPTDNLSIFFSPLTARWVIVNNDSLSAKGEYGVPPGEKHLFQFGAFGSVSYKVAFNKTVGYVGRLDIFSDYLHHPENIDINMTNLFAVKISKILAVTYSLDFIYDDDIRLFGPTKNSPALQVKSIIGAGLLVKL
jgi:hypothetical protein